MQILFSSAKIFGARLVGLPFAITRLYFEHNLIFVTFEYFLSKCFYIAEWTDVFVLIYEIVVISLYCFAKEYLKVKKQRFLASVFIVFSTLVKMYFSFSTLERLLLFLLEFLLKIVLFVYFVKFFKIFKNKFLFFKFSHLDYLMFSVFVFLLSVGLFEFKFIENYLCLFLFALLTLVACKVLPAEKFFVFVNMFSLGAVVATGDYFMLSISVLGSVVCVNLKDVNKFLCSAIAGCVFCLLVFLFKNNVFFDYFSVIFAVFFFIFIPNKFFVKMSALFDQDSLNLICSEIQSTKVQEIKNKLLLMSDTLLDMQNNFKFLLVGKISHEKASEALVSDVISKCCKSCENYRYCFSENINKKAMFEKLLLKAFENKKVTKDDICNGVQTYCVKHGILVTEINQTAKMFLSYESAMKNEDASKLLIASELGNFSDIFSNFAKMLKYSLKINKNSSKNIKEKLLNSMIDSKEVVVLENENGVESINLIAENQTVLKKDVKQTIEKVVKNNCLLKNVKHLNFSGLSIAEFVPSSRFRLNFAVSTKAKEAKNGDSYVISKINEHKYFLAIADGMGHGENAHRISSMVLKLIKSMFEVGFENELVVQSVNKLLIPAGLDGFTTLDACVIDLEKEVCTFVKLGSSVSVVKHSNTSEIVACESLPIGVVSNLKPTIIQKQLRYGDFIFLASDGVVDSFRDVEDFKCFVNDAKIYNLQKYVDSVVFDAGFQNSKHLDDMTIIAVNLLKN